jgi:DNA-binding response OmpR family regulator
MRTLVLLDAGYAVQDVFDISDAVKIFKAGDFDLVIVCHSSTRGGSALAHSRH